jgi:hypothetical protein
MFRGQRAPVSSPGFSGRSSAPTSCTATIADLAVAGTDKVAVQPLIYTGTVTVTATVTGI